MTTLKLTLFLSFFCSVFQAQDTLVLVQKKDQSKEYKIPLKQYRIRVKCKGHKNFSALLMDYHDSMLVFKKRENNKLTRKQIRKTYNQYADTALTLKLNNAQLDSLFKIVDNRIKDIQYPNEVSVALLQLKKIKINNIDRPEKRRLMKTLEIVAYSTLLADLVIFPLAIVLAPTSIIPFIALPIWGLTIAFVVVDIILEVERLNFKTKWTVKSLVKT